MAIIRNKGVILPQGEIDARMLKNCILEHKKNVVRLDKLKQYYDGVHVINKRERIKKEINNKIMVNHAEYITDFATSYFLGNPIKYSFETNEEIEKAYNSANIDLVDIELARDLSIYGVGLELVYQNEQGLTKSTNLDPRNCFIVVDDTVEYPTILGVHLYPEYDDNGILEKERVYVYTDNLVKTYILRKEELSFVEEQVNLFNKVPIIEYWNKPNLKGDFESVMTLIDAYNLLQSDRINDKQQFVDALLVLYGILAGDDSEERLATARKLKKEGVLELPLDARVEYVSKTFHEADIELLKKSIAEDIHKISKVPNLTDENFASNASGVAMKFKLLGLEQLAKMKESYYRIGLKERLELYAKVLNIKMLPVDINSIQISFTRNLPINELEISQLINNLKGTVSDETLLSRLPFIENAVKELERVKNQKEANQESFLTYENQE